MSKHINAPGYLLNLKRDVQSMSDERTKDYAREAMDADRAMERLVLDYSLPAGFRDNDHDGLG